MSAVFRSAFTPRLVSLFFIRKIGCAGNGHALLGLPVWGISMASHLPLPSAEQLRTLQGSIYPVDNIAKDGVNQLIDLVEGVMPERQKQPMTKNVSAFIARTQFGQILERVSRNDERFVVTKKGEVKAIILGMEDFLRSVVEPPESLVALQKQARTSGANRMTIEEIESEIDAVRSAKNENV